MTAYRGRRQCHDSKHHNKQNLVCGVVTREEHPDVVDSFRNGNTAKAERQDFTHILFEHGRAGRCPMLLSDLSFYNDTDLLFSRNKALMFYRMIVGMLVENRYNTVHNRRPNNKFWVVRKTHDFRVWRRRTIWFPNVVETFFFVTISRWQIWIKEFSVSWFPPLSLELRR